MTLDDLADLLKSRGCESIGYFHTDHFEPWSTTIDEPSAWAVDRMAMLARSSSYGRRLSLFYSVFVPYRPDLPGTPGGNTGTGNQAGGSSQLYTVLPGDTLSTIAQHFGVSLYAIAAVNHIWNYNLMK